VRSRESTWAKDRGEATNKAFATIRAGIREIAGRDAEQAVPRALRRPGGGRKRLTQTQPGLLAALEKLVDPATPDGKRFLLNVPVVARSSVGFHATVNWPAQLDQRRD
jgi:hypothetical protein